MNSQLDRPKGFTLVELLAVIAVIGILAAILIPTVSRVRQSARETQARAQFSQWITAIQMFRSEYGFWPDFNSSGSNQWEATNLTPEGNLVVRLNQGDTTKNFIEFLSGRRPDGSSFDEGGFEYATHPNRKRIAFYDFTEADYEFKDGTSGSVSPTAGNINLVDAFGNTDIVIVMDGDRNGVIQLKDDALYQVTNPSNPSSVGRVAPHAPDAPSPYNYTGASRDVRADVIIFSAGAPADNKADAYRRVIRTW